MYIKNSTGPSTEPWGIPLFTGCHEDLESLITTLCCRPERKSVIQFKVLLVTPYCLRTPISLGFFEVQVYHVDIFMFVHCPGGVINYFQELLVQ